MVDGGIVKKVKYDEVSTKIPSIIQNYTNKNSHEISTAKDLAEFLRVFNTGEDDTTFVYFPAKNDDPHTINEAQKLLKSETKNPILTLRNPELAQ